MGLKDVKREDIQVNVLGINHFTWFDYASYKGIDLFPITGNIPRSIRKTATKKQIKTGRTLLSSVPIL